MISPTVDSRILEKNTEFFLSSGINQLDTRYFVINKFYDSRVLKDLGRV